MRIGIDISKALGPPDGIGRYTAGLLAGLAALAGEGKLDDHRFLLYSLYQPLPAGDSEKETLAILTQVLAGAVAGAQLPACFKLKPQRAPIDGEVDLFHCTTHSVPRRYRGPVLFTVYDLTFLTLPAAHTVENRLHCTRGLARALARGARLSTISESSRREVENYLALRDEISVIPPAVDGRFAPPSDEEVRRVRSRHGLDRPYLLSVGTREPRKNLARLIEAFAGLSPELAGGHLLAVAGGAGWSGAGAQTDPAAVVVRLGLEERVRFLGRVEEADLPALYGGADLLAYPSLAEGFGLPPLEAMACGTVVLTGDSSSLPEVVGEAALLVDARETASIAAGLTRLLAEPGLAARLRQAGLERARRFSWRESARRLLRSYTHGVRSRNDVSHLDNEAALSPQPGLAAENGQ